MECGSLRMIMGGMMMKGGLCDNFLDGLRGLRGGDRVYCDYDGLNRRMCRIHFSCGEIWRWAKMNSGRGREWGDGLI